MNLIAAAAVAAMTCVPVHIEAVNDTYTMWTDAAGIVALCGPGRVTYGDYDRTCFYNQGGAAAVGAHVMVALDRHFNPEGAVCAKPMED